MHGCECCDVRVLQSDDRTPPRQVSTARVGGSFRDPSGFVYTRNGTLYRQIDNSFAEEYDACVDSGLYDALAGDGLLVGHEAAGTASSPTA